ncbi:MAG: hypothetical protein K0S61_55 [Anaerocolumna sp.]|nr:hypothetical protein [Anaerocolumna sp.]
MMRSLYSGISGLSVHQTKMDVIGNNIANVNTVGFKASSVSFSDVFYQTVQSATGPNGTTGSAGQNAMQIGLGSKVASIVSSPDKTGGAQRTDNPFDIMINGSSFFVVNSGGSNYFTKAGNFTVDANGTLCTSSGASVMGWQVDPSDPTKTKADTVSALKIMAPENLYSAPQATTNVYVSGNIDMKDEQIASGAAGKVVNLSFYDNLGQAYNAKLVVKQSATDPSQYTTKLEDITDANGQSLFAKSNGATPPVYSGTGYTVAFGGATYALNTTTGKIETSGTLPNLSFNGSTGKFEFAGAAGSKGLNMVISSTGDNTFASSINVDFSTITMYAGSGTSKLESTMGNLEGLGTGRKAGNMSGLSVDTNGKIYGSYDNGDSRLLGQIAVASFSNPAGLESVGGNMFAETQNSGKFDGVGQDVSSDGGSFTTGVLEMSNVDLSAQFTEMITTQRGFQANSRVITTSDTLLEELINLKR